MSKVEEIERAIQGLTAKELADLRDWFEEFQADRWDRQIEADASSGRLDHLMDTALADAASSRVRDL